MQNNKTEILAPAGSLDSLVAAVRCGANAVYLGAGNFNARRHADNFTENELKRAVEYCHVRGVKVYLTLNTIVKDAEISSALELISAVCALGVDALIVQDLGIAKLVQEVAPKMPLHASTQMSVMNVEGFKELEALGFKRAVLPRELSLEEIREIRKNTMIELELFIHGALCMCVSGQCYLSAMLGGRSGNRGLCAQPCRLPFSAPGGLGFDLSLKDLSLIDHLPELAEMGIDSFKIEGRMKRPEYVAAAVTACRAKFEHVQNEAQIEAQLRAVFSRSGFTEGYYTSHLGTNMFGTRQKQDVTAAAPVLKELERLYSSEVQLVPITLSLKAELGKALFATASADKASVSMTSTYKVQKAEHHATDISKIKEQLLKTGGTPFKVQDVNIEIDENINIPLSEINSIRRLVLDSLERELVKGYKKPTIFGEVKLPIDDFARTSLLDLGAHSIVWKKKPNNKTNISSVQNNINTRPNCIARFESVSQIPDNFSQYAINLNKEDEKHKEDFKVTSFIVPLFTSPEDFGKLKEYKLPFGIELPRAIYGDTSELKHLLHVAKKAGASFAYCGTLDGIMLAKKAGLTIIGGATLNAYNSFALEKYRELGIHSIVTSTELELDAINKLRSPLPRGIISYGHIPLMLTRNCPIKNGRKCIGCKSSQYLTDRKGVKFPVTCRANNGKGSEILNSRPIFLADRQNEFKNIDFQLLYFTIETKEQVFEILNAYKQRTEPKIEFTRGLYYRGVE